MDTRERVERRIALARQSEARANSSHFGDARVALVELFGEQVARVAGEAVPAPTDTGDYGTCPVAQLLSFCDVGARAAEQQRGVAYEKALEQLGELCWRGYSQSLLGKAFWRLSGRDVHEMLSMAVGSSRASTSYGERRYERLGPATALLWMRGEYMGPAWIRGFYLYGLNRLATRPVAVAVEQDREPGLDFVLRVTW